MLSPTEIQLILIGIDALTKVIESNSQSGQQATQADVDEAKTKLDRAKAKLDEAIKAQTGKKTDSE